MTALIAPISICGKMSKHTDPARKAERLEWMLARGREGHTMTAIGEALGISVDAARNQMIAAGYRWHAQPRRIRWAGKQAGARRVAV